MNLLSYLSKQDILSFYCQTRGEAVLSDKLEEFRSLNLLMNDTFLREAAKKVPPLMARPLRPNPPPLELNGHRNFFLVLK